MESRKSSLKLNPGNENGARNKCFKFKDTLQLLSFFKSSTIRSFVQMQKCQTLGIYQLLGNCPKFAIAGSDLIFRVLLKEERQLEFQFAMVFEADRK